MQFLLSLGFGYSFMLVLTLISKESQTSKVDAHLRHKREVDCEEKYMTIISDHSACKKRSDNVKASGISSDDVTIILNHHNRARREVSPTATDMMKMTWDDEIANTAQRWAENCVLNHDDNYKRYAYGRFSVGQNLAMGYPDWSSAMQGWENEKVDYDYASNNSPTGKVVGHYTQMIWAKSSKIGCGFARCLSINYYVCNYSPGGNSGSDKPYTSGSKCAACSTRCDDGLCDCGGVVCLNGGTMDFSRCECNCRTNLPFFFAPTCGLNCEGNIEASYCNQYGASSCPVYTNVPQECPVMCNWCPTAEYKATDMSTTSTKKTTDVSTTSTQKPTDTSTTSTQKPTDTSTTSTQKPTDTSTTSTQKPTDTSTTSTQKPTDTSTTSTQKPTDTSTTSSKKKTDTSTTSAQKTTDTSTTSTKKTSDASAISTRATNESDTSTSKFTETQSINTSAKAHTMVADIFICLIVVFITFHT